MMTSSCWDAIDWVCHQCSPQDLLRLYACMFARLHALFSFIRLLACLQITCYAFSANWWHSSTSISIDRRAIDLNFVPSKTALYDPHAWYAPWCTTHQIFCYSAMQFVVLLRVQFNACSVAALCIVVFCNLALSFNVVHTLFPASVSALIVTGTNHE